MHCLTVDLEYDASPLIMWEDRGNGNTSPVAVINASDRNALLAQVTDAIASGDDWSYGRQPDPENLARAALESLGILPKPRVKTRKVSKHP
jgi:hypothetical protein